MIVPFLSRRGRFRAVWAVGLVLLVAAAATAIALPTLGGRGNPPTYSRASAERALEAARAAEAPKWAGPRFTEADERLHDAAFEFRRQELRLYPFRDFREARRQFQIAETAANDAFALATERRQSAEGSAKRALAGARCEVDLTEDFSDGLRFGAETTRLVGAARLHLDEAETLWNERDFAASQLRAEQAAQESRLARDRMQDTLGRFVDPHDVRRWRDMRNETVAWSAKTGQAAVVVNKDEAALTLFVAGRAVRTYRVEIGLNHLERKQRAGDEATPEGRYRVTAKKGPGESKYYKALALDYPNDEDRRHHERKIAQRLLPSSTSLGGFIEIHGEGGRGRDWTRGCVSLRNQDMDDLFKRLPIGAPVTIIGGDGAGGRFSEPASYLASSAVERECHAN